MEQTLKTLEFDKIREILVGYAASDEGRERLEVIAPDHTMGWVRDELARVDELRGFFDRGGKLSGGGTKDPRPILKKLAAVGSVLAAEELLEILFHLRIHQTTRRAMDRERERMHLVCKVVKPLNPVPTLESKIEKVISPEGSVRDNASQELSRLRKAIVHQQNSIRDKLARMLPKLAREGTLRDETFSVRDGRYVLPVRSDSLPRVKGIIHDRSSTGGTLFVEPQALIDIGNELRSLELEERDEVRRILAQLTDEVRAHLSQLEANQDVMTALDVLISKAHLADKLDACVPKISDDGPIRIFGGRHPLLVLSGEREVVPLTLELGTEATTLVISGPNSGGKSVQPDGFRR